MATACLLALIAAACGGGSKAEKLKFDVAKAELTAHDVLINTVDLPGSGWSITDEDPKESDDDDVPDTASCKELRAFQDEVNALDTKSRAARAKREIGKPAAATLATEVSVEIEIYRETKPLAPHLDRARKLVDSGGYTNCLSDLLGGIYKSAGLTATTKSVPASTTAPANGFAYAAESQISGLPSPLRFENYGWIVGNAKITVSLSGSKDALTPELAKAAVLKTHAKLLEASQ
ncbi:MAG TPA: hypothetical protein VJB57_10985 [Dehalococcoidia bacterium]|nr:hypothetical protein [Dehalococcoidia bacterium]